MTGYNTERFYPAIVNSMPDLAIVIDSDGTIQCTNAAWNEYGKSRHCNFTDRWLDINYLDVCDKSTSAGNEYSRCAAQGIRQTIGGELTQFHLDYPCNAPDEMHWYRMTIHPLQQQASQPSYLIRHQEITDIANYIEHIEGLAVTDELTGLGNRRCFNAALDSEWRRDTRTGSPLSLLFLDIDEFKLYNDQNGHIAGDTVLVQIAAILKRYSKRPGDCAARYGGDEFALLLGNTGPNSAIKMGRTILQEIRELAIEHALTAKKKILTASMGIATTYPLQGLSEHTITALADRKLYRAKRKGGDSLEG